jgi:hypothetical protein
MNLVDAGVLVDPELGDKAISPDAENSEFGDFDELIDRWRLPLPRRAEVMPVPLGSPALPDDWRAQARADAPSTSWHDYPVEFGKGFVEGAKSVPAAALKGMAANSIAMAQRRLEGLTSLEAQAPSEDDPFARFAYRSRRAVLHPSPDVIAQRRARLEAEASQPLEAHVFYRAGDFVQDLGKEALAARPGFEGSWTRDVGAGFGSVFSGLGLSLLSPGAATLMYVTAGQGEAADRAIKAGATEEQIRRAAKFGTIAGATDVVDLLLPMLGTTGRAAGFIKRVGLGAIKGAFAEGGQEGIQELIQNAIAQNVYNPNQDLSANVVRSALVAMIVGGGTGGGFSAAGRPQASANPLRVATPAAPNERVLPSPLAGSGTEDFGVLFDPDGQGPSAIPSPDSPPPTGRSIERSGGDPRTNPNSPFAGKDPQEYAELAESLIDKHLLSRDEFVDVAHAVYRQVESERGEGGSVFGTKFGRRIGEELAFRYPGVWRPGKAHEKDVVCITDPSMSFEVKAGGDPHKVVGNRSYALQPSMPGRKSKDGWLLAVNAQDGDLPRVRFGWIDLSDWVAQRSDSGQSAYIPAGIRDAKLRDLYGLRSVEGHRVKKRRSPNPSQTE